MYKPFHQELWRSRKVVGMDVLKEYCVYKCGEIGHYANGCPMKHKRTRSRGTRLYCLKYEKDGHLASWCPNSPALGQTTSVGPLPGWMIGIPQLDKNAINLQCPIFVPHRVAKISKPGKQASIAKKEKILSFNAPRSQRCRRT